MTQEIAKRLSAARKHCKYSQEEAANLLGISRQTLSKWDNGDGMPDSETLMKIADVYDISLDGLMLGREPKIDSLSYEQLMEEAAENDSYEDTVRELLAQTGKEPDPIDRVIRYFPYTMICLILFLSVGFGVQNSWRYCWSVFITIPSYYVAIQSVKHKNVVGIVLPIVCVAIYLVLGFTLPGDWGWKLGWMLLFIVPLYTSIQKAVKKRNFFYFSYLTFIIALYMFMGMCLDMWHPWWIMFLTIPVYYSIAKIVSHKEE